MSRVNETHALASFPRSNIRSRGKRLSRAAEKAVTTRNRVRLTQKTRRRNDKKNLGLRLLFSPFHNDERMIVLATMVCSSSSSSSYSLICGSQYHDLNRFKLVQIRPPQGNGLLFMRTSSVAHHAIAVLKNRLFHRSWLRSFLAAADPTWIEPGPKIKDSSPKI